MSQPDLHLAESSASGDVQERIHALVAEIRANPENEIPLLKLAHVYGQLWIGNQQPEVLARTLTCLNKAVSLEQGQYVRHINQIIQGLSTFASSRQLDEPIAQFDEVKNRLAAKIAGPSATPEATPVSEAQAPQSQAVETQPKKEYQPAEQETADEDEQRVPDIDEIVDEEPELEPQEPRQRGEEEEVFQTVDENEKLPNLHTPEFLTKPPKEEEEDFQTVDDSNVPIPTALPPKLDLEEEYEPEEGLADEDDGEAVDRDSAVRNMATAHAESFQQVRNFFKEERINDIIRAYALASGIRVKRYIIDNLVQHIPDWQIGPVLAIGALESDEQTFRHLMRVLLRSDRHLICNQIELSDYSPDLQKVAAVVLSELGLRSALPKLVQASEVNDPMVRAVAASGIGRAGTAAAEYAPHLVDLIAKDPASDVRVAAAKALSATGSREGYLKLEALTSNRRFDAEVYAQLEIMREKFGMKRDAGKELKDAAALAKEAKAKNEAMQQNIKKVIILLIILAIGGFFMRKQIMELISPAPPPAEETPSMTMPGMAPPAAPAP